MNELTKSPERFSEEFSPYDYAIEGELTVTITLAEYRSLLIAKGSADSRISQLFADKINLQTEIRRLKEAAHA